MLRKPGRPKKCATRCVIPEPLGAGNLGCSAEPSKEGHSTASLALVPITDTQVNLVEERERVSLYGPEGMQAQNSSAPDDAIIPVSAVTRLCAAASTPRREHLPPTTPPRRDATPSLARAAGEVARSLLDKKGQGSHKLSWSLLATFLSCWFGFRHGSLFPPCPTRLGLPFLVPSGHHPWLGLLDLGVFLCPQSRVGIFETRVGIFETRVGILETRVGIVRTRVAIFETRVGIFECPCGYV